jgi:hypothetical protein
MKRIIKRTDLMSKSKYSEAYNIPRPTIDKMILNGDLVVEEISGTHYIKIK